MPGWIDHVLVTVPLMLTFWAAPVMIGVFLATGLRARRAPPIPRWWWPLLLAACAMPTIIVALGFAFRADRPVPNRQPETAVGSLIGYGLLAGLAALPFMLVWATSRLADRRDGSWRFGLAATPVVLLPLDFFALLAAAQMVSGVSL